MKVLLRPSAPLSFIVAAMVGMTTAVLNRPALAEEPASSVPYTQGTSTGSDSSASKSAAQPQGSSPVAADPVKAKLAAKQERKLRTEYLKVTTGIQGPTLKAEALLAILEDTNLVLIDIRQPDEQAVSMIPHAITTQEFAERFRKGIPKQKRIVVYCTIGYRSGRYAMQLSAQRIQAENLEGGLLAWSHAGGPLQVKNPSGLVTPTRRVHIYSSGWNFLHPDYEAVW